MTLIKVVTGLQPLTVATLTGYSITGAGFYKFGAISRDSCISCSENGKYVLVSANYETTTSRRILLSADSGQTFTRIDGTSNLPGGVQYYSHSLSNTGQYQYLVCATNGTVYYSSDYGSTWTAGLANAGITVITCDGTGQYVLVNYTSGIAYSTNYGVSWTTSAIYAGCVAVHISNNGNYWIFGQNNNANGIYMSTNYGASWSVIKSVSESVATIQVTDSGTAFSTITSTSATSLSYYNGSTWSNIKALTTGAQVAINKTGQIIFVSTNRATNSQSVYSLDGGATFTNLQGGNATLALNSAVSSIGNCFYYVTNITGATTGAVYRTQGNFPE
jgi:hypothetical protein